MQQVDVLLGLQWGDEGKGKIVDVLTPKYDLVARFQGGPNAGHTLEFEGKKYVLRSIPSGIFQGNKINIIGNGVVLDPILFKQEAEALMESGHDIRKSLYISRKAHLILPTHRLLDQAREAAKGAGKIGTTGKGIGPTYTDKISRNGLRVGDIELDIKAKYDKIKSDHFKILAALHYVQDTAAMDKEWFDAIEFLKSFRFIDSEFFINDALQNNKAILAEGAQGTLLDIDFGSYPFVTSSNTVTAGACTGLGVSPKRIGKVFGIFKAYCTRVGSGPFPTELHDATGEEMCRKGNEFGSVTGRKRRCGWLDLVALRYSVMLNGVTDLIMMKSDVLDMFEEINVCTSYIIDGKETDQFPFSAEMDITPVYKIFDGWQEDMTKVEKEEEFPAAFKTYLNFIEEYLEVSISVVSVGPDRKQTILRKGFMSEK